MTRRSERKPMVRASLGRPVDRPAVPGSLGCPTTHPGSRSPRSSSSTSFARCEDGNMIASSGARVRHTVVHKLLDPAATSGCRATPLVPAHLWKAPKCQILSCRGQYECRDFSDSMHHWRSTGHPDRDWSHPPVWRASHHPQEEVNRKPAAQRMTVTLKLANQVRQLGCENLTVAQIADRLARPSCRPCRSARGADRGSARGRC